jgi:hypothetical protein
MPQTRWPIVTTSISGISREVWDSFKIRADEANITDREAMEAAIRALAEAVRAGKEVNWPHTKHAPLHSIRTHESVKTELKILVKQTGLKQSVVVLAAMKLWMENRELFQKTKYSKL